VEESSISSKPTGTNHRTDQTNALGNRASVIDAARAFAVMLGPSLVLDLFAVLGTLVVASGWLLRHGRGFLPACSDRSRSSGRCCPGCTPSLSAPGT
jgi:hypothetical protein